MRPVPLYLLTRISNDIERIDGRLEQAETTLSEARLGHAHSVAVDLDAVRAMLNEMRCYVNDAAEPMAEADPRAN